MKVITNIDPRVGINSNKLHEIMTLPAIIRVNKFDEETVAEFEDGIGYAHQTGQPVIPVIIDSYGGQVYACHSMIAAMLNSKIPIATIVTGKAMSAGAVLFGFGTDGYRFMDKHAVIMIHDAASWAGGKNEEIKARSDHLDTINTSIFKRLAKHLGHTDDNYFLKLIQEHGHADWYLTAAEAKKHRLANHIRVPEMQVDVKMEITFDP